MSVSNEINRLKTAKSKIKTSLENKGVVVSPTETLDNYSDYIDQLPSLEASDIVIPTTHADLLSAKNAATLKPGGWYRITDFVTKTGQAETTSANHQFDILVLATATNQISEIAKACLHEGDTYFADSNLNAWQLKYCLTNDTNRFKWATSTGKGVIYEMIDEFGNKCGYDFKNIKFKRYKITAMAKCPSLVNTYSGVRSLSTYSMLFPSEATIANTSFYAFTFDTCQVYDLSLHKYQGTALAVSQCFGNEIAPYYVKEGLLVKQFLNNIVFLNGTSGDTSGNFSCCGNRLVEEGSYSCTFGSNSHNNIFDSRCYANVFHTCANNRFGVDCHNNTLGQYCGGNTFADGCHNNILDTSCTANTFGYQCSSNTFESFCQYNTLGKRCYENILGSRSENNTLGNSCTDIQPLTFTVERNGNDEATITANNSSNYDVTVTGRINDTIIEGVDIQYGGEAQLNSIPIPNNPCTGSLSYYMNGKKIDVDIFFEV